MAVALAVVIAVAPANAQLPPSVRPGELLAMDPLALTRFLQESRPAPVPVTVTAQVVAGLPTKGQVHDLDERERRKLAALAPVLEAAGRESVYVVKVIDVPDGFVGLHARAVVLITRPALRLLSEGELRALVAHETGHEYVHDEYERASAKGLSRRLQALELVCDIIAVIRLRAIGQDASTLAAGIEKLSRFNHFRLGGEIDHPDYPPSLLRRSVTLGLERDILLAEGRR
jgi:hypothetical protein